MCTWFNVANISCCLRSNESNGTATLWHNTVSKPKYYEIKFTLNCCHGIKKGLQWTLLVTRCIKCSVPVINRLLLSFNKKHAKINHHLINYIWPITFVQTQFLIWALSLTNSVSNNMCNKMKYRTNTCITVTT